MGKQAGPINITGTIGNLTFYKMNGKYYVRKKSSLSRSKVLKSPNFERTMAHADELKVASPLASSVYRTFRKEQRVRTIYNAMVGHGKQLLHKGKTVEEVRVILVEKFRPRSVNGEWSMVNNEKLKMKNEKSASTRKTEVCGMNIDSRGRLVFSKNVKLKMENEKKGLKTSPAPYGALLEEILKLRACLAPYSAGKNLQF